MFTGGASLRCALGYHIGGRFMTLGKIMRCGIAAVLLVVARIAVAQDGAAATARPNILYIMSDDHAAHALSCYGSKINQTPNLDRLAAQGMRFENGFVTNALCGPSRACVLTGKYSHINGFPDNKPKTVFHGSQQTFIKLLHDAGYQTGVVGKWHLVSDPTGFDHWSVLVGQGRYFDPIFITNGKRETVKGYVTDLVTDKACDCLKNRKNDKPFCLCPLHKEPLLDCRPRATYPRLHNSQPP